MPRSKGGGAQAPSAGHPLGEQTELPMSQGANDSEQTTPQGLPSPESPAVTERAPASQAETHLMDRLRTYVAQAREVSARSSRWLLGR